MSDGALLARARQEGNPLMLGSGRVCFVCDGPQCPRLVGDFNNWADGPQACMEPAGENCWALELELPEDAYVEYILFTDSQRCLDPFNHRKVPNGLGDYNNYFVMPGRRSPHVRRAGRRKGVPNPGRVVTLQVDSADFLGSRQREVTFYAPPVRSAVPLVVVYDGGDYLRIVKMARIVDHLIAEGTIAPLGLAFVENGGDARTLEYACAESTLRFLLSRVIPCAGEQMRLLDLAQFPGSYGVVGASMGGLMALYSGLRQPEVFGKVLAQSGGYTLEGYEYIVWDLARRLDPGSIKVWMDVGGMEYLLDCNRAMFELLQSRGFTVAYREYSGGHNYTSWAEDIPAGLQFLYGKEFLVSSEPRQDWSG